MSYYEKRARVIMDIRQMIRDYNNIDQIIIEIEKTGFSEKFIKDQAEKYVKYLVDKRRRKANDNPS